MPVLSHYGAIYADPPWDFKTYSHKGKGRSAEAHYDCMGLDAIKGFPGGRLGRAGLRPVSMGNRSIAAASPRSDLGLGLRL